MSKNSENKDTLGTLIKSYEEVTNIKLPVHYPVIIRLDGKNFSRFTKHLEKPSYTFLEIMGKAMVDVASDIEGCVFGYTQSDEISFVLRNDQSDKSQPWFGNRLQKMASIAASSFCSSFIYRFLESDLTKKENGAILIKSLEDAHLNKVAFDARVFTVPKMDKMIKAIWWRQKDCMKNAVSMAAYEELGKKYGRGTARKMLNELKTKERIELMKTDLNINFKENYKSMFRKGIGTYRQELTLKAGDKSFTRKKWIMDTDLPIFGDDCSLLVNCYLANNQMLDTIHTEEDACTT